MFPIGDENPTYRTPYITYLLIAINLVVFVYEVLLQNEVLGRALDPITQRLQTVTALDYFFNDWAVVPAQFTASLTGGVIRSPLPDVTSQPPEWITLVSSQFLHGSWSHVLGNMLFLWIFGNNVEDKLGHAKFLLFYLGCGILAGLAQWFFSMNSYIPSLGASGAIAGVMGAYILRFPTAAINTIIPPFFVFQVPAFAYLGIWFIQQAFYSFASLAPRSYVGMEGGGIAYWAHAGGFVFGAILGPLLGLFQDDRPNYR